MPSLRNSGGLLNGILVGVSSPRRLIAKLFEYFESRTTSGCHLESLLSDWIVRDSMFPRRHVVRPDNVDMNRIADRLVRAVFERMVPVWPVQNRYSDTRFRLKLSGKYLYNGNTTREHGDDEYEEQEVEGEELYEDYNR